MIKTSVPAARVQLAGRRTTRQKRVVWKALAEVGPHCTADQIIAHLAERNVHIAKSTVYRALDALEVSGSVYVSELGSGCMHFEIAADAHQHVVCQICGEIGHIDETLVDGFLDKLSDSTGFKSVRPDIVILGVCRKCSASARSTAKSLHQRAESP